MPENLKPCPFCGGRTDIYRKSYDNAFSDVMNYTQVGCVKCGIFMSTKHYEMHHPNSEKELEQDTQECIEAWNRRAKQKCKHFKDRSRFVELPCKVGDTVYFILRSFDGKMRINPEKVYYFTIDANELRIHTTAGYFTERDMNDGVFFTRERAEQVLKERIENDA